MGPIALARWQWSDYADFHGDRRNLLIHLIAVPTFELGNVLFAVGLWLPFWLAADAGWGLVADLWTLWLLPLLGILMTAAGIAWQGIGHNKEANPAKPFTGAGNALGRIFVEQWLTFPRFVFTGGWRRAWRDASPRRPTTS